MSLTAPYTNAMRIGQGFNTYTQEIRLENAVKIGPPPPPQNSEFSSKPLDITRSPLSPPPVTQAATTNEPHAEVPVVAINGIQAGATTPARPGTPASITGGALDIISTHPGESPFTISGPPPSTSQSVTYSTRAIENVSDIMDALNISTSMSIKYGTIHGNGNSSFVNENKVLDSELNYVVSVIVNNDAHAAVADMEFIDTPGLPLERFTEVYGDSFISGFTEGGEFSAVISIKLTDKSKYKSVKQAVDVQLAVGPPTLEIGASESFSKEHSEALRDTEISISVNWVGGGEIKKPEVPWTIQSVVAVANAFPSMVSRSSARTQAILSRYTSLRSFQAWKWTRLREEKEIWEKDPKNQKGGENNKDGTNRYEEPVLILNYVTCSLYTAELFDAFMNHKKLWKRIGEILQNLSQYKIRPAVRPITTKSAGEKQKTDLKMERNLSAAWPKDIPNKGMIASPVSSVGSPCDNDAIALGIKRAFTFDMDEGSTGWNLTENNMRQDPIPPEPVALNEARLLCREAMTLITEEAFRLVDHPHLAYAEYNSRDKTTRMKRPNYVYPEVLALRLPVPIHADILADLSTDGAYLKTIAYSRRTNGSDSNLFFEPNMVGDTKATDADLRSKFGLGSKYEDFSTLDLTEERGSQGANPLRRIALHRYTISSLKSITATAGLKAGENAIGTIGIARIYSSPDEEAAGDGCTHHFGHLHRSDPSAADFKALEIGNVDVTKIRVAYLPGSGYIAGLTFLDQVEGRETERLAWRQWEGQEPDGLKWVVNEPPERGDGVVWKFVGLSGSWVDTMGKGHLLARITGIWKKVEEDE